MASNHTENWGLNQWEAEDAVFRADFNEDNQKIEAALTKLSKFFSIGEVTGYDATADVTINLGRQPALIIIFCKYGFKSAYGNTYPGTAVAMPGMIGYRDAGSDTSTLQKALEVTDTGFTVYRDALSIYCPPYYYLALFDPVA